MKLKNLPIWENKTVQVILRLPILFGLYLRLVARRFMEDGCQHSAAALTYMTLFAVVPVMTLMYSMFSLVPAFQGLGDQVRDLIFANFIPSAGAEVQSYLDQFSSQARRLSLVGVGVLVVTCYLMLLNIEKVFNRIWATSGRRKGVVSFLLYWAILSLGPILIGATIAINTYLLSARLFGEDSLAQGALNIVFSYLPWLLTASAFTLLYMTVPNCKVMLRNAVTGGIVATLAFELAKRAFGYFIANSAYSSIYGAFAVLPIFLLWIYLSWMIILGGAEFVRATENFSAEVRGQKISKVTASLWVLWKFWQAQQQGSEVRDMAAHRAGMNSNQWREVRDMLLENNIITVTDSGNYVLLRSLEQTKLSDLVQLETETYRDEDGRKLAGEAPPCWLLNYRDRMKEVRRAEDQALDLSLAELFSTEYLNDDEIVTRTANIHSQAAANQQT